MIPVLPCVSLPDTLAFYRLLGFEVTYEQTRPYVYGAVRRGGMNVHFMGIKGLDPKPAFSVDVAGNSLIFIKQGAPEEDETNGSQETIKYNGTAGYYTWVVRSYSGADRLRRAPSEA